MIYASNVALGLRAKSSSARVRVIDDAGDTPSPEWCQLFDDGVTSEFKGHNICLAGCLNTFADSWSMDVLVRSCTGALDAGSDGPDHAAPVVAAGHEREVARTLVDRSIAMQVAQRTAATATR